MWARPLQALAQPLPVNAMVGLKYGCISRSRQLFCCQSPNNHHNTTRHAHLPSSCWHKYPSCPRFSACCAAPRLSHTDIPCPSVPTATLSYGSWPPECANLAYGQLCVASCVSGGSATVNCLETGAWNTTVEGQCGEYGADVCYQLLSTGV